MTKSVKKQEQIVKALYDFVRDQNENVHNVKSYKGVSVHRESVGNALKTIMGVFNYEVTEIQ